MPLRRPDKSSVKQAVCGAAIVKRLAFQFQHGLTDFLYCRGRRERCSERDGYGVWPQLWPLPKETAFFETEDAAPELVQMNGNDRKICPPNNLFETALKGQQMPDAADAAFGEDANHLTVFQFLARTLQRMDNVAPVAGGYGDGLHEAEK